VLTRGGGAGDAEAATAVGTTWICLGPFSIVTAVIGFYGAYRVKFDVLEHIEQNKMGTPHQLNIGAAGSALSSEIRRERRRSDRGKGAQIVFLRQR
jgi:hypothetical protein